MTTKIENTACIRYIPLNNLRPWEGNVRKTMDDSTIGELAASIDAHGLLSHLVVRPSPGDEFSFLVIAGVRRLAALNRLAENGTLAKNASISCKIITTDSTDEAMEISLAENVVREPMHPADQFETFKNLIDHGASITDIATRFGVSETVVKKRLTLANLAPEILEAFRAGKLTLAHVQAFAASDDHARQMEFFKTFQPEFEDEHDIRNALTEGRTPATDKRAQFVTLPVYEQAGGIVSRDLFCTDDSCIFIEDPALLDRLVIQQMESEAESLRAQGWSWVDLMVDYKYDSKLKQLYPDHAPIPPEVQTEISTLEEELSALEDQHDTMDKSDDQYGAINNKITTLSDRIAELETTPEVWAPAILANSGVILSLNHDGSLSKRYFERPEAAAAKKKNNPAPSGDDDNADESGDEDGDDEENESPLELPAKLVGQLTAHRAAMMGALLSDNPDIALAVLVHRMGMDILYGLEDNNPCLGITATNEIEILHKAGVSEENCKGLSNLAKDRDAWMGKVPEDADQFWAWCLKQKRQTLLNLQAFLVGHTVDAVCYNTRRLNEADALAEALNLDMAEHFKSTTENYFKHIGKITILANLAEALDLKEVPPAWQKLGQEKLAELAEREISGTGWIPEPLRAPPASVVEEAEEPPADESGE